MKPNDIGVDDPNVLMGWDVNPTLSSEDKEKAEGTTIEFSETQKRNKQSTFVYARHPKTAPYPVIGCAMIAPAENSRVISNQKRKLYVYTESNNSLRASS